MHSNNEKQKNTAQEKLSFVNSPSYNSFWHAANFATIALATSAGVVAVQSPIKTMLVSLAQNNTVVPAFKGGILGCVRMLYSGSRAAFGSSSMRSAYTTGAKLKPGETIREEGCIEESHAEKNAISHVVNAAIGEVLVCQIPASLADCRKANILPQNFKWNTPYNVAQLLKGNFPIKCLSSGVSFYSLCVIEPKYAGLLAENAPYLPSDASRFVSGAFSGMTAAIATYPLAAFIDYTQVRAQVKDGRLVNKSPLSSFNDLAKLFVADPKGSAAACCSNALKQIPLRMLSTGAIFGVVAYVGNLLGEEPLRAVVPEKFIPSPGQNLNSFFKITKVKELSAPENAPSKKMNS